MNKKHLLVMIAPLALAACGESESAPTGQVAATVGGEEITTTDIQAELAGARGDNAEQQKNLERMALENIINRTILAQAAEKDGLAKGPEAAVLERKARQAALIQLLQQKVGKSVPTPSAEEVQNFINDNPSMFARRQISVVDQIIVAQATEDLLKALQPVNSLEQAKTVLSDRKLPFNETVGVIDALTVPPQAAAQLANLPPDEVFIIPSNGGLRINHVRSKQIDPLTGEAAAGVARELLSRQRSQTALQAALADRIKAARTTVKYNDAFAPPPEAARAAAPSAAGAAQQPAN